MNAWVILVTFRNGTVNTNEGYKTYEEAKNSIYKKIEFDDMRTLGDYRFFDINNEILYEIKNITIF